MRSDLRDIIDDRRREDWERLIYSWIHDEINRRILTRNLLDGVSLSELPQEIDLDRRTIERRYQKAVNQLLRHIDG